MQPRKINLEKMKEGLISWIWAHFGALALSNENENENESENEMR